MRLTLSGIARYSLSIIIVFTIFGIFQLTQYNKEKTSRIEKDVAQTAELRKTQQQLTRIQNKLDIAIAELQKVKLTSCQELNVSIKRMIITEFIKDSNLMNQLLPPPRNAISSIIANTFITTGVRSVKDTNPLHDCSAKTLGIIPLPKPIPSSVSGIKPTTTPSSSSPKAKWAGRRQPKPTHPPHK